MAEAAMDMARTATVKPMLEVRDLHAWYGESHVLHGINLDVGYSYAPTVTFRIDSGIGGPSAGLIFALAVYDKVTHDDLIAGRVGAGRDEGGAVAAQGLDLHGSPLRGRKKAHSRWAWL